AVATACFTQNRSIIRLRHGKTPYELLHSKLPDLSFFHVFGALCYLTNDSENLDRLKSLEANFSEYIQTNPFAEAVSNIPGNKSIQRSDEQRNLYKALVDTYEADKIILDSYGETVILKRRCDDDDDQEEGPFVGSGRGSKRRREEEPVQTTCQMDEPSYPVFETGADDQPIVNLLSILNGFLNRRNLQLRIMIGTRPCLLSKEALNH
nr:integrase, catalytic region, zinc finger, CCHC-type, peptidase aspartic, catalytic [Tanacetum cinerariifolium]